MTRPIIAGMSHMQITPVAGGVRFTCSGCCVALVVPTGTEAPAFEHWDFECPVRLQVAAAEYEFLFCGECDEF